MRSYLAICLLFSLLVSLTSSITFLPASSLPSHKQCRQDITHRRSPFLTLRGGSEAIDPAVPPTPPPFPAAAKSQMVVTLATMLLTSRLDLNSTPTIKLWRILYILHHLVIQALVLYVIAIAKSTGDTTPLRIPSPLTPLLNGALSSAGSDVSAMLSNSLTKSTTYMQYDIDAAKGLRSAQIVPLCIMYYLHFRRGSVQPLVFQTVMGFFNVWKSDLFRGYVMGEEVERPFGAQKAAEGKMDVEEEGSEEEEEEGSDEEEEGSDEEEEVSEDEEEVSEDEDTVSEEESEDE